jgi:sulfoxide reductase heme-binding subunit YedZ
MWKSPWLPRLVFAACLAPMAVLIWHWQHNQLGINAIEYVQRYTGRWALRLLLASLAVTPLRRIPGLGPIQRFRRMLGLFAFFYGVVHGWHYFARDAQWNLAIIREDLTIRRFFIAGAVSLALMAPLAATSFDRAIRWMGGRRWQLLHRLVYVSAIAAVVHYLWQGKGGLDPSPLVYSAVLALLLGVRVVFAVRRRIG